MGGQMIMAGFRGMSIDRLSTQLLVQLDSGYLGGVILFDYDLAPRLSSATSARPSR
jgi:hypothetical protein